MYGFSENNCRLCQKVFCCKECRIKHETKVHKVFPDCDVCVYGKLYLENVDDCFLKHIESSHLPLHCVYCKKIFSSIEELLIHKKCSFFQNKEGSPKTPFPSTPAILVSSDDHDSPILNEFQKLERLNYIIATSTPMHRGEEPDPLFEKSKEVITPVDKPSRVGMSIIKKTDSAKSDEMLTKRRVTFGEAKPANSEQNLRESLVENQKKISSDNLKSLESPSLKEKQPNEQFTPVSGGNSGQFFSAKTETEQFYSAKTNVSSKPSRDESNMKELADGFTPVGIPNKCKIVKGDIYKKQDDPMNEFFESKTGDINVKSECQLDEVPHKLCIPAETVADLNSIDNNKNLLSDISPAVEDVSDAKDNNEAENIMVLCTPAKTLNSGKIIVKGDIYKETKQKNISSEVDGSKENKECDQTNEKPECEDGLENNKIPNSTAVGHDTLWLSAVNLEETSHSEIQNDENKRPDEKKHQNQEEINSPDTQGSSQKRVNIVMPTPILKTTNVQMKFNFPAHLSSTPIITSHAVKVQQTRIVTDNSSRVLQHQTPYKTPRGNLCRFVQKKLVDANLCRNIAQLTNIESGASIEGKHLGQLDNIKDYSSSDTAVCKDVVSEPVTEYYEDSYSLIPSHEPETGISVSSMTDESSLWSSMTKIVKSVFGGFTSMSQDSSMSIKNVSSAFKRQLSDNETGDLLEAPRLKRFKFTDIKCRRAIRDLPTLDLPRKLPTVGSIEIMKSVSTLYTNQTMKIMCDKATQTDDYLMYS